MTSTSDQLRPCPDCKTLPGCRHRAGCDVERCSACGGQRLSCACPNHDPNFSRWAGFWPGQLEAAALGIDLNEFYQRDLNRVLFVKPSPEEVVVPIALIVREGLVFMTKRSPDTLRPSMWELPGGKVEAQDLEGDQPTDSVVLARALRRELREELGVHHAKVGGIIGSCMFAWRSPVRVVALHVDLGSWNPEPNAPYEHRWTSLEDALDHLPCVPSLYCLYTELQSAILR